MVCLALFPVNFPSKSLPLIDKRLQQRSADNHTLERAAELKALLGESIKRLKPRTDDAYSTSDEWRHYNVLYYPYVLGLKPLSRRLALRELDEEQRMIAEWFRSQVPERTLHNWQNAAAELVARDLRERMQPKFQSQMHKEAVRIP